MSWLVWIPAQLAAVCGAVFVASFTVGWLQEFRKARASVFASWSLVLGLGFAAVAGVLAVWEHHP